MSWVGDVQGGSVDPRACAWGCTAIGLHPVLDDRRGPAPETVYLCTDCRGRGLPPIPEVKPRFRRDARGRLVPLAVEAIEAGRLVLPKKTSDTWVQRLQRELDEYDGDEPETAQTTDLTGTVVRPAGDAAVKPLETVTDPIRIDDQEDEKMGTRNKKTESRRDAVVEALRLAGPEGLAASDVKAITTGLGASKSGHLRVVRSLLGDGLIAFTGARSGRRYYLPECVPAGKGRAPKKAKPPKKVEVIEYPTLDNEGAPVADAYRAVLTDLEAKREEAQERARRAALAVKNAEEDRANAYALVSQIDDSIKLLRRVS